MRQSGFLDEGQLVHDAALLAGIPGVIVQGRYDACTPMRTAWDLHRGLARVSVDRGGRRRPTRFDEPGIQHALVSTTDRFAD